MSDDATRALEAARALGLDPTLTRHARVSSLAEAAALRGIEPRDLVKTLVVRRGSGDYLFVLVPGTGSSAGRSCGRCSASTGSRCPTRAGRRSR